MKLEETLVERHTIGPSGDYAPHVLSSYYTPTFGGFQTRDGKVGVTENGRNNARVQYQSYHYDTVNSHEARSRK